MARVAVRQGAEPQSRRATFVTHLLADAILAKVLPRLAAKNIDVLLVKGIVTGRQLYDDVSERPISDIDLRVRPERLPDVARLVEEEGWELLRYSKTYGNVVFRLDGFCVDVEVAIGPPGICSLRVADMIARAERVDAEGQPQFRPELHDHALLLCVNVFKDKLTYAAPWAVRDVARVVTSDRFDVERLITLAKESCSLGLLWIVADWMATVHSDSRWSKIRDRIGPPPRPYYARLFRRLVERDEHSFAIRLLARVASDSRRQQVRALAAALVWEANAQKNGVA